MFKEFKDFILTGNVVDLAVAVILAAAIGLVVNSFTNDVVMPVVGHFTGGSDFSEMTIPLSDAVMAADGVTVEKPANAIRYGAWINTIINLIIVGFVMFIIVKAYNSTKAPVEEEAAGPTQEELLAEIRDHLAKR